MKSLLTKIISVLTITALCVGLTACKTTDEKCASGHTWKLTSTTATCFDSGVENYECEVCKTTKTENVSAYGHDLVQSSYTAPTCKTNGEKVEKCTRCGFESKQTILVIDHDYQVKSTTPSTCTVQGSQLLECSMCHETKTESLELTAHTFELINTIPSTCVVHGSKQYKCRDCTATKSEQLELAEHKYETKTVEATCFTHGGTIKECSVCHDKKPLEETPILTHNFGADGYCTHCGIYETLFDETQINANIQGVVLTGNLAAKFNQTNKTIADNYWKDHIVTLTVTMFDKDGNELENHSFTSTTIPHTGEHYGKLTIQYVDVNGKLGNGYSNAFIIFVNEGDIFSPTTRQNCKSFKIELSCDGYEKIEKTYQIEK